MTEQDAPDEQDYLDFYAAESRELQWEKWPEKFVEPLSESERDITGDAFYDAWNLGLAYGRSESQEQIRGLREKLHQALNLAEVNLKSARRALDLWKSR